MSDISSRLTELPNLFSKRNLGLIIGGGVLAGAGMMMTGRMHEKSRQKVRARPENNVRYDDSFREAVLAGNVTASLFHIYTKGTHPGARTGLLAGTMFGVGLVSDLAGGQGFGRSLTSNTLTAGAALGMTYGFEHGLNQFMGSSMKPAMIFNNLKKNYPILNRVLSSNSMAIGLTLMTIPVAHRLITNMTNRMFSKDPGRETAEEALRMSRIQNQAGLTPKRKHRINTRQQAPYEADFNMKTNVRSTNYVSTELS